MGFCVNAQRFARAHAVADTTDGTACFRRNYHKRTCQFSEEGQENCFSYMGEQYFFENVASVLNYNKDLSARKIFRGKGVCYFCRSI